MEKQSEDQVCHRARVNYGKVPGTLILTGTILKWKGAESSDKDHFTPLSNIISTFASPDFLSCEPHGRGL